MPFEAQIKHTTRTIARGHAIKAPVSFSVQGVSVALRRITCCFLVCAADLLGPLRRSPSPPHASGSDRYAALRRLRSGRPRDRHTARGNLGSGGCAIICPRPGPPPPRPAHRRGAPRGRNRSPSSRRVIIQGGGLQLGCTNSKIGGGGDRCTDGWSTDSDRTRAQASPSRS